MTAFYRQFYDPDIDESIWASPTPGGVIARNSFFGEPVPEPPSADGGVYEDGIVLLRRLQVVIEKGVWRRD